MSETSEVRKIRRAGVKLIPKFPVAADPEIEADDNTISADPEPRKVNW